MAASGNITLYIESVDYNGGGPYTRGAQYSNLVATWNVDNNGYLTLTENSYSTNEPYWWICSSQATNINNYRVEWKVQFKPDGGSWQNLYTDQVAVKGPCVDYTYLTGTNVKAMMETFCSGFPGVQLTSSGELRVVCGANKAPNPDAGYPYAFPNDTYSEASQVPVHIDVSWTATVKYDANGGTGAPGNTTGTSTASSQTLTLSSTAPTRTNYKFLGWATSSSATTAAYQPGGTVTIQKSSPTLQLYAVWEAPWTATLRYAGEGSGLPSAQTATVDANVNSYNFTVSSTIPTRSNYRFDGWAIVGGGVVVYHGGDTYTIQKSSPSKYLYAVWTAYWTATVHYDANGGTGAPADQTASVNPDYNTKTFTVSNTIPTRTNYRFEGWSYGGNTYHGGDTVTVPANASTANLVAIWTEFYRPGERRVSGTWSSHNRSGGACERKVSGTWTEMRTIDGGTGTGDEPTRKSSGTWYNQRKLGAE